MGIYRHILLKHVQYIHTLKHTHTNAGIYLYTKAYKAHRHTEVYSQSYIHTLTKTQNDTKPRVSLTHKI